MVGLPCILYCKLSCISRYLVESGFHWYSTRTNEQMLSSWEACLTLYPAERCGARFPPSVCLSVTLFCAQLLLQFLCDSNQTFTEWLSPSAAAHIVIILRFHYLLRSYCPLFKFTLLSFCAQILLQFLWDFYETFTEWWSPNAAAHIVRILWFHFLSRSSCPCFKFTLLSFCAQLLLFCAQLLIQFLCDLN